MAGDSVGGNAAIALTLAAKQHCAVPLAGQVCSPRLPTQVSTHALPAVRGGLLPVP
ncbi:hypothetical protein [Micromonospora sp. NBC_00860]|uniref:hypothetical protein n=1 Tax=Micromonospora sp. NBC_00860 TaxID=2975980 RepID=UPI00386D24F3